MIRNKRRPKLLKSEMRVLLSFFTNNSTEIKKIIKSSIDNYTQTGKHIKMDEFKET